MKEKEAMVSHKRVTSSVQASMKFEGLNPSAHARKVGENYLEGKISSQQAREMIRSKHAANFGK